MYVHNIEVVACCFKLYKQLIVLFCDIYFVEILNFSPTKLSGCSMYELSDRYCNDFNFSIFTVQVVLTIITVINSATQ